MKPVYRCWDTVDKKWYNEEWVMSQSLITLNADDSRYIFTQWTGQLDCESNKIFEGDILSYFSIRKIVAWNQPIAMWGIKRSIEGKIVEQLGTVDLNKSRVVGNVYENEV